MKVRNLLDPPNRARIEQVFPACKNILGEVCSEIPFTRDVLPAFVDEEIAQRCLVRDLASKGLGKNLLDIVRCLPDRVCSILLLLSFLGYFLLLLLRLQLSHKDEKVYLLSISDLLYRLSDDHRLLVLLLHAALLGLGSLDILLCCLILS